MTERKTPTELHFSFSKHCGIPIIAQITGQLRDQIQSGRLSEGMRLPSTRALATTYGLSRSMVATAYEHLVSEGYLLGRPGYGTVVQTFPADPSGRKKLGTPSSPAIPIQQHQAMMDPPTPKGMLEFRVCQPSTQHFPMQHWRSCVRQTLASQPISDYADPQGEQLLRREVAAHVQISRGIQCDPAEVLITNGAIQAINLIAQGLFQPGDRLAYEEPGYRLAAQVIQRAGIQICPLSVDETGWRLDMLETENLKAKAVYLTPSHQFPTGERMSAAQRRAVLAWAQKNGSWIIEDDYDSEFRFDAAPLPAMASQNRSHVLYVGTFSKALTPSLRVGYLIAPAPVIQTLVPIKALFDYHSPTLNQMAIARFMGRGHFAGHLRKMRRVYGEVRAALKEKLSPYPFKILGLEAGLHLFLACAPDYPTGMWVQSAHEKGLIVRQIGDYYRGPARMQGLVLGYGDLNLNQLDSATKRLIQAMP